MNNLFEIANFRLDCESVGPIQRVQSAQND